MKVPLSKAEVCVRTMLAGALLVPFVLACGGMGGDMSGGETTEAAAPKLEFSNWKVEWVGHSIVNEFDFLPGGTFVDPKHPSDVNTWTVTGTTIHMTYNDSFVIYDGEFVDAFTMGGTYTTQGGDSGAWRGVKLLD